MSSARPSVTVTVIGAGISGAACAAALRGRGVAVQVVDRARAPGGRMSAPTVHGRRVDLGAAYFTVRDEGFRLVVDGWAARGLARRWTDAFDVFSADGRTRRDGPTRWAAPDGLRSLVRDIHGPVSLESPVATLPPGPVVLAMPDPQAARLLPDGVAWVDYEPVIAVAAGWDERCWQLTDGAFVNDDPAVSLLVDDGSRRGDGAPVLVAHTTPDLARRHLADPAGVLAPVVAAIRRLLGVRTEPAWTHAHRWTFAKPVGTHGDEPYVLRDIDGRPVGVCGDSWCPSGAPRVESAWLSGTRLGDQLAADLGA